MNPAWNTVLIQTVHKDILVFTPPPYWISIGGNFYFFQFSNNLKITFSNDKQTQIKYAEHFVHLHSEVMVLTSSHYTS